MNELSEYLVDRRWGTKKLTVSGVEHFEEDIYLAKLVSGNSMYTFRFRVPEQSKGPVYFLKELIDDARKTSKFNLEFSSNRELGNHHFLGPRSLEEYDESTSDHVLNVLLETDKEIFFEEKKRRAERREHLSIIKE